MSLPTTGMDETSPSGSQAISLGDDRIREYKTQNREVLEVDHVYPSSGQSATAGYHKQVTLVEAADIGTGATGLPILGAQTVSGKPELTYTDEDNNDVQLTNGGKIHIPIDSFTEKTSLDEDDEVLVADSEASLANKKVKVTRFIPTGIIMAWTTDTAPNGWKLCDGSAISRSTYSDLFAIIGTTYGTGDGSTTFNLPNLKGKVIVGYNASETEFDNLGETGGEKTHTLDISEMPAHSHTGSTVASRNNNSSAGTADSVVEAQATNDSVPLSIATQGGGGAHNNLQPYISLNYIIKL